MSVKALREQRGEIAKQMYSMVERTGGKMSDEDQAKFDQMDKDLLALDGQIDNLERVDDIRRQKAAMDSDDQERRDFDARKRDKPTSVDYRNAFRGWCLQGTKGQTDEMRTAARKCGVDLSSNTRTISLFPNAPRSMEDVRQIVTRASTLYQAAGSTSVGSEAVDTIMAGEVETQLLAYGGMREVATVIRTATGGTMYFPTNDDTGNKAIVVGENTQVDTEALIFKQKAISTYKYSSQFVRASIEFLQDVNFNAPAFIGQQLGVRVARGLNTAFTVGAAGATTSPIGVASMAVGAATGTTGATTDNITYTKLLTLQHGVDQAYRRMPGCRWMMHDHTLRVVKALVDGNSRPLWLPSLSLGEPDTLLGYPFTVNNDMATNTTATGGVKLIIFGDMGHYLIRDVMDVELIRANERFVDYGQVGWLTFSRHGGDTIAASTANWPIRALHTAST